MKASGDRFQIWGVVILIGIFAGGLYNGHRHTGQWPIPDALILASLVLYAFLLVRRAETEAALIDSVILGVMTALAAVDIVLLAMRYGGGVGQTLKVLPLLILTIYLGSVNVRRRRATVPT